MLAATFFKLLTFFTLQPVYPHDIFLSPNDVTVLEGATLRLHWPVSCNHSDIEYCYWKRRHGEHESWLKFVGWINVGSNVGRRNMSTTEHVGWEFLSPKPCVSGIWRKTVTTKYATVYRMFIKDRWKREATQDIRVQVVQASSLAYSVSINGTPYGGTIAKAPELPSDLQLKHNESLPITVLSPWASDITISRSKYMGGCEGDNCVVDVNAGGKEVQSFQALIAINSAVQGAEIINLRQNFTVLAALPPAAGSSSGWIVFLCVLVALAVIVIVAGILFWFLKLRKDPKDMKKQMNDLEQEVETIQKELIDKKSYLEQRNTELLNENASLVKESTQEDEHIEETISQLNAAVTRKDKEISTLVICI